ncbi:LLM class flavin-dependent oxidoreductase [Symbioplanes lichenis]|uniref:LLM class flavin-dependent oxidoreductase n=1 Tax=Symbioplanes lichenis TaxID=1629072 RepID=UPI00273935A2|nr:LLM class flavin-dependent oxidoreductase [Actinoplanes lichenis]
MRYGLELPCGGDGVTAGLLVELGVRAEAAGWDGVFFEDYLVYYRGEAPATYDPWVLLTAIAARTERVRLGTTVSGLLARDPVKLAREAATLQALAPGRVVLGVGLGDPADKGAEPFAGARGPEMDRRLARLLDLLGGEVPVWVGGSAEAGAVLRRAATAQGIVPYKLSDTEDWSDFSAEEVRRLDVRPEFDIAVGGRRRLADVAAERAAIKAVASGGATWWLEFVHPGEPEGMRQAVGAGPLRVA